MLSVVAGELKFTDKECGQQTHWTWEQENFVWGTIRHKVTQQNVSNIVQFVTYFLFMLNKGYKTCAFC